MKTDRTMRQEKTYKTSVEILGLSDKYNLTNIYQQQSTTLPDNHRL